MEPHNAQRQPDSVVGEKAQEFKNDYLSIYFLIESKKLKLKICITLTFWMHRLNEQNVQVEAGGHVVIINPQAALCQNKSMSFLFTQQSVKMFANLRHCCL